MKSFHIKNLCMKKKMFSFKNVVTLIASIVVMTFSACNDGKKESTTTSNSDSLNTTGSNSTASSGSSSSFDENASYVDLKTGKKLTVKRDPATGSVTNRETNEPLVYYYYNPTTRDTFDAYGRVVNSYLIRSNDGSYTLDEQRWKVKMDKDGDIKIKDGDDTKLKVEGDGSEMKLKTDSGKIKADEDGIKKK